MSADAAAVPGIEVDPAAAPHAEPHTESHAEPHGDRHGDVVDLSDPTLLVDRLNAELIRHQRLIHMLKTIMSGWAPADLDWGSLQVLIHLIKEGPQRQGEIAERILLDASTVSRRVGALVKLGYVRRLPDPADGRAVRLAATDTGLEVFARFRARREETMRQMLSTWRSEDVAMFLGLLSRLNDDLDTYRPLLARTTAADPIPPFPARTD